MFEPVATFSGFSVDNTAAAVAFYREKLGVKVEETPMGVQLHLPGGQTVFVYEKPDHAPATFTVLNFVVADIDAAVDALTGRGVAFEQYDNMQQDDKGIARGKAANMGPDIAWFKDPAGNVLAVLQN